MPRVRTDISARRVLVSEFVEGVNFEAVKKLPEAERDRYGEILFRFFMELLHRERFCSGDPHPGNYIYCPDGKVCFLDFGLMKSVSQATLDDEWALAEAVAAEDPEGVKRQLATLGYLPDPDSFDTELLYEQVVLSGEWAFVPGFKRLDSDYVRAVSELGSSPKSPYFKQIRQMTLPPEAMLVRRMETLIFAVLGELGAGADWNAIGREYWADAPPSTDLGALDSEWRSGSRR